MNKSDLRVQKTIRQIDQSLLSALKDTAFDRITVEMLCRKAMINRSTFYRYYEDKYDLLKSYTDRVLAEFRECVNVDFVLATAVNVNDPVYQANFSALLTHIYSSRDIYLTLTNGSIDRDIWEEMAGIVEESIVRAIQDSGPVAKKNDKYVRLYARLFSSNMMSIVLWWLEYGDELTIDDIILLMTSNMKDGLFKTFKGYL